MSTNIILVVDVEDAKVVRNLLERYQPPAQDIVHVLSFNAKLTKAIRNHKRKGARSGEETSER